ncbi:hypothetical protein [Streptomyces sp. t39]|nr:hypothetical protein [Streptomyces sp. t39]
MPVLLCGFLRWPADTALAGRTRLRTAGYRAPGLAGTFAPAAVLAGVGR